MMLVKALPHKSSNYFETVCCAGVGHDMKWRRLYPVAFRTLENGQKFSRWDWVSYSFTTPSNDQRTESQKVVHETISVSKSMKSSERSSLARRMTRESTDEAAARGESLTLLKPEDVRFSWRRKTDEEVAIERIKHAALADQLSFLHEAPKPLEPCPFEFTFKWKDIVGKSRTNTCDDWETSTAFFVRRAAKGEQGALASLRETFEIEYPQKGMRFALGTHSRRNTQWLLVGVIRVDEADQRELSL
ncbi:MAG: hypothetical protein IE910_12260 [Brevundimonas sp.]|nr:hypothetical protein [Brevundimonas sp.]